MISRCEAIRQVLAGMEPEETASPKVSISGSAAQINIIEQATFTIDSVKILHPEGGLAKDMGERLSELVYTLAVLESSTASRPVTPQSVWLRLKNSLGLPSGETIPVQRHQEAVDFMAHRLALACADLQRDPKIARKRSGCYKRCHGIANQYRLYDDMRSYMVRRWGAESMRNLEDEELWSLEVYLRGREREIKKS